MTRSASSIALALVEAGGLEPAAVRADRVLLRCPFHDDRRPSAVVLASGVLTCSSGCARSWSPYSWLVELGRSPAEVMALLDRLGVRDGARNGRRALGTSRSGARPAWPAPSAPSRGSEAQRDSYRVNASQTEAGERADLGDELLERLELARLERRRLDPRLGELRGFSTEALDLAGAAIGLARGYGFRGPRAALDELRLLLPVRDRAGRPVGLLAIAPNPERRHEPKVIARPGTPRLPLELLHIDPPLAAVLLVTEGELDALAAASAGIPAIGLPGVAGLDRHAARIAELVREHELEHALLVPDADAAGRSAFRELAAAIAASGVPAVLADVLEDGDDVGSFLVAASVELAELRPELSPTVRRAAAGARLLALALNLERRREPRST